MNPYDFYVTPEEYEQAAAIGVDGQTLDRRIRELGWGKERAVKTPIRPLDKGRTYWRRIAEKNGIGFTAFHSRIRRGWSDERAATKPLQTPEEARTMALKATEKIRKIPRKYMDLANKNGIAISTLRDRLKKGWDPIEAASKKVMSHSQRGTLGAAALRAREGDWGAQIFGKR